MSILVSTSTNNAADPTAPFIEIVRTVGQFVTLNQPYTLMVLARRLSTSSSPITDTLHWIGMGQAAGSGNYDSLRTGPGSSNWSLQVNGTGVGSGTAVNDITYHLALRRSSSTNLQLFVDGASVITVTNAQNNVAGNTIRLHGGFFATNTNNNSGGHDVVYDCLRLYDVALTPTEIATEAASRRAVRTTNLVFDLAVLGPGDFLSYGGSCPTSEISVSSSLVRCPPTSVISYYDLVQGPLTGSPPSEQPIIDFFGPEGLIVINGQDNDDMTVSAEYIYSRWKEWVAAGNAGYLPAFRTIGGDPIGGGVEVGAYFFLRNDLGWKIQPKGHTHELTITGNLYPENEALPVFELPGDAFPCEILVKQQLSSLTQVVTVTTGGGGGGGSSSVYIGDTPPSNPVPGDLWWNSSTGLMMIYYYDGNSSQWVVANPTGGGGGTCPTAEEIRIEMDTNSSMLQNIYQNTVDIEVIVTDIQNTLATSFPTLANIADAVWEAALNQYSGGSPASAGFIVSTILNEVIDVHSDTNNIQVIVNNITSIVEEILKYDRNRTRIDKAAKTLTVYDDDGTTPIRVFNLLDGTGAPSVAEVCERDPA